MMNDSYRWYEDEKWHRQLPINMPMYTETKKDDKDENRDEDRWIDR